MMALKGNKDNGPIICASIGHREEEQLEELMRQADSSSCDWVEWRVDYLCPGQYRNSGEVSRIAGKLKRITSKPLILTMRTEEEGGLGELSRREYVIFLCDVIRGRCADAVDIEAFSREGDNRDALDYLVNLAEEESVTTIISHHDFSETPASSELIHRIASMEAIGGDFVKVAVTSHGETDLVRLKEAMKKAVDTKALTSPAIVIAMGEAGRASRIFPEEFHSVATFAALSHIMAPGQLTVAQICEAREVCD